MLFFCTDLFLFGRVPLLPEPQKNTDSSIEGSTVDGVILTKCQGRLMIFEVFGDGAATGKVIFENTGTGIIFEKRPGIGRSRGWGGLNCYQ